MNLKSFKLVLLTFLMAVSAGFSLKASADNGIYQIDFGIQAITTNPSLGQYWNNWPGSIPALTSTSSLIDSTGATSTVEMYFSDPPECAAPGSSAWGNGGTASNSLGYPSSVSIDYFYDGLGGCSGNFISTLVFTGLNPSYTYNIRAFSSRASSGVRLLKIQSGSASSTVDSINNTGNTAYLDSITPTATSSIAVTFSSGSPGQYHYVNAAILTANTPNIPPVVDAGTDITITSPTSSITLSGSASDADGTLTARTWSMFSGEANAIITSTSSATTTVTGLYPGKYTFRLSATDNNAITVTDDMTVTVIPATVPSVRPAKKIVVLGSSTAEGFGSIPNGTYENSWVKLFEQYMKLYNASSSIVNLGLTGLRTCQVLPTGYATTTCNTGFPIWDGTVGGQGAPRNITAALAQNPDAIILSFTTNDGAASITVASSTQYIRAVVDAARAVNVPVWITTSIGRSNLDVPRQNLLIGYRDAILAEYGTTTSNNGGRGINIWDPVANADGTVRSPYGDSYLGFVADGTHINNYGHSELFRDMVTSNILNTLYSSTSTAPAGQSTAGSGSATISWSAPINDGGMPILSYRVYDASNGSLIASPASSTFSYQIDGLASGSTNSYYVTAINGVGESASSTVLTVMIPAAASTAITTYWSPGSSSGSGSVPASLLPFVTNTNMPTVPGNPNPAITSASFSRSLTQGAKGEDVKKLQQYLNAKGFVVSASGAGSKGKETTLFGPATKAALIRFQKAMKITPAIGFFGPITRAAIK